MLGKIAMTLDYSKFRGRGLPGSLLGPVGVLSDGLSAVFEDGDNEGD